MVTWVDHYRKAWSLMGRAERRLNCRPIELLYGPAVAESGIRTHAGIIERMMPKPLDIERAFAQASEGEVQEVLVIDAERQVRKSPAFTANEWTAHIWTARPLAHAFSAISGDEGVAVGPRLSTTAQVICVLAHKLPPEKRQAFQASFVWDQVRRETVLSAEEQAAWNAFELQLGMGILASMMHARQVIPDLTPEETAAASLKKYGIPLTLPGNAEAHACHWCGTAPCSCGGAKAPARKVTLDEAKANLHRGPVDTMQAMYVAYGWANTGRGGVGYGPLRALIEAACEKGSAISGASLKEFENQFGPLFLRGQRHWAEILKRETAEASPAEKRQAILSELVDAVHWQFLYWPGFFDHAAGLERAIAHFEERLPA